MQQPSSNHFDLFGQMYNLAPIALTLTTAGGTILNANPAFCQWLGYTEEELTGQPIAAFTHSEDAERERRQLSGLLAEGAGPCRYELRYLHKDGHDLWAAKQVTVFDEPSAGAACFLSSITDITAYKKREHEQEQAEAIIRLIPEHAQEIIHIYSNDGICRFCSPAVTPLLGHDPKDFIGSGNLAYFHPEDVKRLAKTDLRDCRIMRYRLQHKDGHYLWFETTYSIVGGEGNDQRVLAIAREISNQRKDEEILAEAERIAAIGSWEWDMRTDEFSLSEQLYQIFGIGRTNKKPRAWRLLRYIQPDDRRRLQAGLRQAKEGEVLSFEFQHFSSDGAVKYLHLRGVVTMDGSGHPIRMIGTVQDITDRKLIEFKLQESIERYTSLKEYNHDTIISFDLTGTIMNTNRVAEQLTGYTVPELKGTSLSKLVGKRSLYQILHGDHEAAEKLINKVTHKDGYTIEVLVTLAPIIINAKNVGYYLIIKDIMEQKQLLIAKETAERMNEAKSEFLAMMSHEIRTPMNGVIGMTDLLLETTELDPEQREYVGIIHKSGEVLLTIINDILDFSKIEYGKTELLDEPLHVKEVVSEVLDILYPKLAEKELEVQLDISPDIPELLYGDPYRLNQVLTNIVGNAVKFTDRGSIGIDVKQIQGGDDEDEYVVLKFTVSDTGVGIPPEKRHQLFQPFSQLEPYMARKKGGTGLGLAISKKLVRLMGGDIWVENPKGTGAVFSFTVKLKTDRVLSGEQHGLLHPDQVGDGQLKILIAEDNPINQLVLRKMVERLGHEVDNVETGLAAVEAVTRQAYDIVFMDLHMPELNGFEATRQMKEKLPPGKCPHIIAVTAHALRGDRELCLAAGMDDYISKPIKNEIIASLLEQYGKQARRA